MNISLSWDLFTIVFFIVILAYSLIIGRDSTLKVILGTYVSMIAADSAGYLFAKYFAGSEIFMKILKLAAVTNEEEAVVLIKIVVFIMLVILFAVKGAFTVSTVDDRSAPVRFILSVVYSIMSAGLIITAILVFVSGVSLIGGDLDSAKIALWDIYNKSQLIRSMVNNASLWFFVPALSFLVHSLYSSKE